MSAEHFIITLLHNDRPVCVTAVASFDAIAFEIVRVCRRLTIEPHNRVEIAQWQADWDEWLLRKRFAWHG